MAAVTGPPADQPARDRILAAAEKLFAEGGFDRTSTARIAQAAAVPHGLIFYHFRTKLDLLLAVVGDREAVVIDDLVPRPPAGTGLTEAVAEIWRGLSEALGQPSALRRIIFQELAAHPEVRLRARELHDLISAAVSEQLARASGNLGRPGPEHHAAGRLLSIAAGMAPLLGEPGQLLIEPGAVAALIAAGLSSPRP